MKHLYDRICGKVVSYHLREKDQVTHHVVEWLQQTDRHVLNVAPILETTHLADVLAIQAARENAVFNFVAKPH